jgi:transposase
LKDDFFVLYPINPATLAQYRQACSPSQAKDDPQDADSLLEVLLQHRDRLKAWRPDNVKTRTLQYLVEHRRRLVHDRTRISNRMTAPRKASFPQVLQCFDDIRTPLVWDFLLRWPTLEAVQKVRPATLARFFHAHNSVRKETLAQRRAAIKAAVPLPTDQAVLPSSVLRIKACATQMQATIAAIRHLDRKMAELGRMHEDDPLCASLPGAGAVYAARLTAAMGTDSDRWATVDDVLRFSGVAPVLERSGKSTWMR